jgi:hypothetical protein
MDAPAERELGPNYPPSSNRFWDAYSRVSYEKWSGEEMKNKVWEFVGGSVGKMFAGGEYVRDPAMEKGPHHSGIIAKVHADAYAKSDPGVMPVSASKLPV